MLASIHHVRTDTGPDTKIDHCAAPSQQLVDKQILQWKEAATLNPHCFISFH